MITTINSMSSVFSSTAGEMCTGDPGREPVRFRGVGGAGRQPRRQEPTSSWPWLLLPVATTVPSGRHPTVCRRPAANGRRTGTATSFTTGSLAIFPASRMVALVYPSCACAVALADDGKAGVSVGKTGG